MKNKAKKQLINIHDDRLWEILAEAGISGKQAAQLKAKLKSISEPDNSEKLIKTIIRKLNKEAEKEVYLWVDFDADYDEKGALIVKSISDVHNYAIDCYQNAIEIIEKTKEEARK